MKKLLLSLIIAGGVSYIVHAQDPYPDCTNLLVDSVYATGPDLRVVLSNTCTNCASGINGAVYLEMVLVRRSNPVDTFARAGCYCFNSPPNNGQLAYVLPGFGNVSIPQSDLKIVLYSLCDDIPFGVKTGISDVEETPNPIFYQSESKTIAFNNKVPIEYRVINSFGQLITSGMADDTGFRLNVQNFPPGMYMVETENDNKRAFHKIVIH